MHPFRKDPNDHNLLLLHGMFGNPGQWRSCAEHVSPGWRVLRPVLPLLDIAADETAICVAGDHMIRAMDAAGMGGTH